MVFRTRNLQQFFPNPWFWLANILVWLSVLTLFSYFQSRVAFEAGLDLTWWQLWVRMSPWFLNYIWVTAAIFIAVLYLQSSRQRLGEKIAYHLLLMVTLLILYWAISLLMQLAIKGQSIFEFASEFVRIVSTTAILDVLMYLGILAVSLAIGYHRERIEERIQLKRLQSQLAREQLKSLRSQLNPHFLFNALNTIASLVRLKREPDAINALSELSCMLRKILESKNDTEIKIKDEITFINSYLAIQKLRFSEKLDAHVDVGEDCLEVAIPNMLLHPLVENAVQHGSQLDSNKNMLNLHIRRQQDELQIRLTNKVAENTEHHGFGIGLTNTRERLSRFYDDFVLELNPLPGGLFETWLAIPIGDRNVKGTGSG